MLRLDIHQTFAAMRTAEYRTRELVANSSLPVPVSPANRARNARSVAVDSAAGGPAEFVTTCAYQ
jgi:hypothetical protein